MTVISPSLICDDLSCWFWGIAVWYLCPQNYLSWHCCSASDTSLKRSSVEPRGRTLYLHQIHCYSLSLASLSLSCFLVSSSHSLAFCSRLSSHTCLSFCFSSPSSLLPLSCFSLSAFLSSIYQIRPLKSFIFHLSLWLWVY